VVVVRRWFDHAHHLVPLSSRLAFFACVSLFSQHLSIASRSEVTCLTTMAMVRRWLDGGAFASVSLFHITFLLPDPESHVSRRRFCRKHLFSHQYFRRSHMFHSRCFVVFSMVLLWLLRSGVVRCHCVLCCMLWGCCFCCLGVSGLIPEDTGSGRCCLDPLFRSTIGSLLLRRRTHSPCHWRPPFYDRGCVSASNRRRCPCFVVRFHLPLDLCLCCYLFLGEAVWWRSDVVVVVVMRGGDAVEVAVIQFVVVIGMISFESNFVTRVHVRCH